MSSPRSHLLLVDQQTLDHLLAGVRAFQYLGRDGRVLPEGLAAIATDFGNAGPLLDTDQLDTLAINLNTGFFKPQFSDCVQALTADQSDEEKAFITEARAVWHKDGEVEIDDHTVVSVSEDGGAYVLAWVWTYDPAS